MLDDAHLRATGFFREYVHPTEGALRDARSPFRLYDAEENDDRPAPRAGAQSREVLHECGYDDAAIDRLVEVRAVACAEE